MYEYSNAVLRYKTHLIEALFKTVRTYHIKAKLIFIYTTGINRIISTLSLKAYRYKHTSSDRSRKVSLYGKL